MRTNFRVKRNWKSNFKSIKRINWSFLVLTIILIEVILIILITFSHFSILWISLLCINTIFFLFISWKIFLIFIPVFSIILTCTIFVSNKLYPNISEINSNLRVKKVLSSGIIAKNKFHNFYIKTNNYFCINDLIHLKTSNIIKIKNENNFFLYLKSIRTNYIIEKWEKLKLIESKYSIIEKIKKYFEIGGTYYSKYVPLLLFGNKTNDNNVIVNKMKTLNLLHLFVISGFHINMILIIIEKLIKKLLKIKNKYLIILIPLILLPYIFLIDSSLAATKSILFYFTCSFNKYFLNQKISKLNISSFIALIFILFNHYIIFSLSFILTFAFGSVITLISINENKKNKKVNYIIYPWIISTIINCYLNKMLNVSAFIANILITPLISISFFISVLFFWIKPLIDNYFCFIDICINLFLYLNVNVNFTLSLEILVIAYIFIFVLIVVKNSKPKFYPTDKYCNNLFYKFKTHF